MGYQQIRLWRMAYVAALRTLLARPDYRVAQAASAAGETANSAVDAFKQYFQPESK